MQQEQKCKLSLAVLIMLNTLWFCSFIMDFLTVIRLTEFTEAAFFSLAEPDPCSTEASCPHMCTSYNRTVKCLCQVGYVDSQSEPGKCIKVSNKYDWPDCLTEI